jgi:hypothetical protein
MNSSGPLSIIIMVIIFAAVGGMSYLRFRRFARDRPRLTVRETTPSGKETVRLLTPREAWKLGGRTRLSWLGTWRTLVFLFLGITLLVFDSIGEPVSLVALLGGTAVGVCVGIYALRLTTFEAMPTALYYYRPHLLYFATLLPILLYAGGRFGYRALIAATTGGPRPSLSFSLDPLMLLCSGHLLSCYASYYIGLLRWRRTVTAGSN